MADISVTAASVVAGAGATTGTGTAGESITAGMPLYVNTGDSNRLYKAIDTSAAAATCVGISEHAATAGQPIRYVTKGNMTFNAVLTAGLTYYVSDTAGGICPASDVGQGDYATPIGTATSTTNLYVNIYATGVALA